jgi:two-component system, LytTR family, sensor kinase
MSLRMTGRPRDERSARLEQIGLTLGLLAVLALFFALQGLLLALARGLRVGWHGGWSLLLAQIRLFLPWALLVPLLATMGRPARDGRTRWYVVTPLHLAACAVACVLVPWFWIAFTPHLLEWFGTSPDAPLSTVVPKFLHINALIYFLIVGFWSLLDYHRRLRDREVAAARLAAELADAELRALRAQVHPHFLFNALHAVSALLRTRPDDADRMIGELSALLRASLRGSSSQQVPLGDELRSLGHYVEIMRIRFEDRLDVRLTAQPDTLDAAVPSFILQPLVENAIKHGVGPLEGGGTIEVEATRDGKQLMLQVRDTGAGFDRASTTGAGGHGLSATRERLRLLYGAGAAMVLANGERGGAVVTLTLPFTASQNANAAARDT